jgi:hypothetical protein
MCYDRWKLSSLSWSRVKMSKNGNIKINETIVAIEIFPLPNLLRRWKKWQVTKYLHRTTGTSADKWRFSCLQVHIELKYKKKVAWENNPKWYNSYLCIKAKKCIFFVRVWVFWPRRRRGLKTGEDKRHF